MSTHAISRQNMHSDKSLAYSTPKIQELISKKIAKLSQLLSIEVDALNTWVENHALAGDLTLLAFLHMTITHKLDPLLGEATIWMDADKRAHPSITIDGWMKILNSHPAFAGITFDEGQKSGNTPLNALPDFISCTIYRTDRQQPIAVREYYEEVKSDHPMWKSMPRRMLRHRALQQCARLAFGISIPDFLLDEKPLQDTFTPIKSSKTPSEASTTKGLTRTQQLKVTLNRSTPKAL